MNRTSLLLVAGAALAASAVAAVAQPAPRAYVAAAAASDTFEITEAQMALSRAKAPRVREFARTMIAHHGKSTDMIKDAVRRSMHRNPPPPVLENHQRDNIRDLKGASPRDFDRVYMTQQVEAHTEALELHRRYAEGGSDPELKRTAGMIVPVVQRHLAMARDLADHMR